MPAVVKTLVQLYTAVQIEAQKAKCGTEAALTAWMAPQHFFPLMAVLFQDKHWWCGKNDYESENTCIADVSNRKISRPHQNLITTLKCRVCVYEYVCLKRVLYVDSILIIQPSE